MVKSSDNNNLKEGQFEPYYFYNPHNARFYFNFDRKGLKIPTILKSSDNNKFEVINGNEILLKDFKGCSLRIKKKMIEVVNQIDSSRRFKIQGSLDEIRAQVIDACALLEKEAIVVLKRFIELYGGISDYVVRKAWIPDNKILHDDIVDSLPEELTFRNEVVKKVYREKPLNIEMASPVFAANYFRNAGLRDFAPEIVDAINKTNERLDALEFKGSKLNMLKLKVKKLSDVKIFESDIRSFEKEDLEVFSDWLLNNFNGCSWGGVNENF